MKYIYFIKKKDGLNADLIAARISMFFPHVYLPKYRRIIYKIKRKLAST